MSLGGGVEKGKRDPNVPKIIFLLIKTYFSEYLRPERSPAARRSTFFKIMFMISYFEKGKRGPNNR